MSRYLGKKVLVTGGTSGIGFAAARRFQEEGASVAITGANSERLGEAEAALPGAVAIRADAGDVAATIAAVEEAAHRLGGLDVVFANAGVARFAPLEQVDAAFFDEQMAINVRSVLFTAQAAAKHLPEGGAIVVNTSVNNRMGMAGTLVYAATKAAARSLVRTLAGELASHGIRVNAVSPGPTETPIYGKLGRAREQLQSVAETLKGKFPLERFGTAEEIAGAALYLASDDASFVTGAELEGMMVGPR